MADYSRFDKIEYESDEDDCHPNIEINTWRRLKERMRREKGIKKKEPILIDKYNTTSVTVPGKRKGKIIAQTGTHDKVDKEESNEKNEEKKDESNENGNENGSKPDEKSEETGGDTEKPVKSDESTDKKPMEKVDEDEEKQPVKKKSAETLSSERAAQAVIRSAEKSNAREDNRQTSSTSIKDDDEEIFVARSDPSAFLNAHMKRLKKFASIEKDVKARAFLLKRPFLVHEAAQGFMITYAVDRAVEGASEAQIAQYAFRCLQIHNLVESCRTGNVKPEIGVPVFYRRLQNPKMFAEYQRELKMQQKELIERIKQRRIERLREAQEYDGVDDEDLAPIGPGGLDPTVVLNSLPKLLQDAFMTRSMDDMRKALDSMTSEEAQYHMQRCVDAGLWVADTSEEADDEDGGDAEDGEEVDDDDDENDDDGEEKVPVVVESEVPTVSVNHSTSTGVVGGPSVDDLD